MEFSVRYDQANDLIHAEAWGHPDVEGFLGLMDAAGGIFDATECRRLFSDYRRLDQDFDHLEIPGLDRLAEHYLGLAASRAPFTSVIVCADGTQFALTRVWEVLSGGAELAVERRVFLDPDAARRWLDRTRPPRAPEA